MSILIIIANDNKLYYITLKKTNVLTINWNLKPVQTTYINGAKKWNVLIQNIDEQQKLKKLEIFHCFLYSLTKNKTKKHYLYYIYFIIINLTR